MRKIILLLLTILTVTSLSAQKSHKKVWFDLQLTQNFGLNQWTDASYVNDGFPRTSSTDFKVILNVPFSSYIGAFADMGVAVRPSSKMRNFNLDNMPLPHIGNKYYIREMLEEKGSGKTSASFKMTAGLFGKIAINDKSSIMPYLGVGFTTLESRKHSMILKEEGTNVEYETSYYWNQENNYADSPTLGYLNIRANYVCKISTKSSLLLGLELTHHFSEPEFYGEHINVYNNNIRKRFRVQGNKLTTLGISVGISFM